ncbi:hypothetical protein Taro_037431 [Colocasia esculenta]|uniref:Homeobox domain-containing protein n=1 Tax=Colocasia esculenta TaxID=4460 RepID=A0A843W5N3_COLES|nr:hypothetical protein [Colocasia esculenta]
MEHDPCNTSLALGLGVGLDAFAASRRRDRKQKPPVQFHILFPACAKGEEGEAAAEKDRGRLRMRTVEQEEDAAEKEARESSSGGNGTSSGPGGGGCSGGARKKLRLTNEQSTLLEHSFRERNTLTPTQKQELAERLNLRPRQVEVWFQNRRARTKLKQTEVDCEFLKKCCESLSDENRRLKKELQELRSIKPAGPPFYVHLPKAATLNMCPSCERIAAEDGKVPGVEAKPRFYNCAIKDSSMAC